MKMKQVKSIFIVANGQLPKKSLLIHLAAISDCIIAANGGCNLCYQRNIYPHFIVGDLDSAQAKVLSHFKDAEIIRLADQNRHDLDKAIGFAKTFNPEIIRIVAAFGKRTDHSLANLILLQKQFSDVSLEFYDDYGILSVITGKKILSLPVGKTISLFSFLPIYGLSLTGFKYPLQNKDFPKGFNGLSNVISSSMAQILIKKGSLFIYTVHEDNLP